MSFEHLPADIELGIQSCASELHISHDEAVLKVLEVGLLAMRSDSGGVPPPRSRKASAAERRAKLASLAELPPERANAVFGAFSDVPGFQESIDAVIARRAQRYGFTE